MQIIIRSGDLKLLVECGKLYVEIFDEPTAVDGIGRDFDLSLPSWSPNWVKQRLTYGLWGSYSTQSQIPFAATGTLKAQVEFHVLSKAQSHGLLIVHEAVLEEVAYCSQGFYRKTSDLTFCLNDIFGTLKRKPFILTWEDDEMSAIMRTITVDRNVSGDKLYWDTGHSGLLESFKHAVVGRKL
jgi:hypothetical protein